MNQLPPPHDGTKELSWMEEARRELARKHLVDFIPYVDKRFGTMPPHVPMICEALEGVLKYIETGKGTPILIIEIPPRHLKTTIVSKLLPAYFLGRNPTKKVISTSYAASLSYESSKEARALIQESEDYRNLFGSYATSLVDPITGVPLAPVSLRDDSRAQDRWVIDKHRGEYTALGIGGPVTGRGGHLIIIDDPYPNRATVESQVGRKNVWEYFISTLWTRREKDAAVVIIMQRWREDDLVGKIKQLKNPNDPSYRPDFPPVKILTLPALAEPNDILKRQEGEALWPDMYNEQFLRSTHDVLQDYYFNSQYQQRPTAPEGNIFKRTWFPVVPEAPVSYKIQYVDPAEKEGEENDYWAFVTLGVTQYGIMVIDYYKEKMTADKGEQEIRRRYDMFNSEQEPISVVWIEEKSSGVALVPMMQAGDSGIPIAGDKPKLDKVARANVITGHCSNRRVVLRQHSPWIADFLDDMTSFPTGAHDDGVDALVGGVSKLLLAGYINPTLVAKQLAKTQGTGPITGGQKRNQLFGTDGKGVHTRRGGVLRRPPNFNS